MNHFFSRLAEQYGYPFYLYDEAVLTEQLTLLRSTFPDFTLLYSVKTNPHDAICRFMAANGCGADAASSQEVRLALKAGIAPEQIWYSAPGKTREQLADALGKSVITADSYTELARLDQLAGEAGLAAPLPVGLRINPDMAFGPGEFPELCKGVSMKFGVDEESLAGNAAVFASLRHIRVAGIHVYLRSQILNHVSLAASFEKIFKLAAHCRDTFGWDMNFINFGGGLGIPTSDDTLDIETLQQEVRRLVAAYSPSLPGCSLLLESGRFLVSRAGTFITRIEDIKVSRGTTYVIAPGSLNGFLRPPLMNLLAGLPFPVQGPFEPLYTNAAIHRVSLPEKISGTPRKVTVCGNLCTGLDVLARDILLPEPEIGDILSVANAGAYAATLSPFTFASFPRPPELYRERTGLIRN